MSSNMHPPCMLVENVKKQLEARKVTQYLLSVIQHVMEMTTPCWQNRNFLEWQRLLFTLVFDIHLLTL